MKRPGANSVNHPMGSKPMHHSSVDNQRMQQFKSNMREIQQNVKKTEEVLNLISQNNSRNHGHSNVRSPS